MNRLISRYVIEGGTIVALVATSGLESILGVTAAPTHYDEGFLNVYCDRWKYIKITPSASCVFHNTSITNVSNIFSQIPGS